MRRGELWWINFPRPVGRRPGLILEVQDDGAGPVALVAPSSRQVRGTADELELTPEDGVAEPSVLRMGACRRVPTEWIDAYIASLPEHKFRLMEVHSPASLLPGERRKGREWEDDEDPGASPYPFAERPAGDRSVRVRDRDGQERWIAAAELGKWMETQRAVPPPAPPQAGGSGGVGNGRRAVPPPGPPQAGRDGGVGNGRRAVPPAGDGWSKEGPPRLSVRARRPKKQRKRRF